jgi:hypothetical protein
MSETKERNGILARFLALLPRILATLFRLAEYTENMRGRHDTEAPRKAARNLGCQRNKP